jgi:hypothetical protein
VNVIVAVVIRLSAGRDKHQHRNGQNKQRTVERLAMNHAWDATGPAPDTGWCSRTYRHTRGIAIEFAKKGVRCNAVVPGEVSTAMTAAPELPEDPDFTIMARQGPLNGAATPDQIASVIAMLASDDGAYINGAEIRADGGGLS